MRERLRGQPRALGQREPSAADGVEELSEEDRITVTPTLLKTFPAALLGRLVVIPYYPLSDAMLANIVGHWVIGVPVAAFMAFGLGWGVIGLDYFIVLALLNWFIAGHLHVPETLHTPEIHAGALPRLADIIPRFH